jgi:hypothetical protein
MLRAETVLVGILHWVHKGQSGRAIPVDDKRNLRDFGVESSQPFVHSEISVFVLLIFRVWRRSLARQSGLDRRGRSAK